MRKRGHAQQRLHLTGLSCAEIDVEALTPVVLDGRLNGKPARQVSQIVGRAINSLYRDTRDMTATMRGRRRLILLGTLGFLLVLLCLAWLIFPHILNAVTPRPLHPTYAALRKHGFYVFVLSEDEVVRRGWEQSIRIWSWDIHCGLLQGDTYNPLSVNYHDSDGELVFWLKLGPWYAPEWSPGQSRTEMSFESPWSSTGTLAYYTEITEDGTYTRYYFVDMQGYPVVIGGQLPFTETLELIESLEYVGPPLETLNDPWDCR